MKFNKVIKDIIYVSKLTKTANKKLKILYSVILANLTVLFDLIVILTIAKIFEDDTTGSNNFLVAFF